MSLLYNAHIHNAPARAYAFTATFQFFRSGAGSFFPGIPKDGYVPFIFIDDIVSGAFRKYSYYNILITRRLGYAI